MSGRLGRLVVLSGVALGALVAASPAFAGSFGLREQSTVGQGMSFAGMAAGGGDSISGMFWNPAVVNQVEHFQGEQHVTGIFPSSKIDVDAGLPFGDGGDIGKNAALTAGYSAYRLTEDIAVGLSINTPFGLATDPNYTWAGQFQARSSRVRSINASPTIGYRVNDMFSVAVGMQIQWFDIRLRQALPLAGFPTATLRGDDIGVGFTAGMTFKPVEGTEIGVGFRSSIKHNIDGKLQTPAPDVDIKAKVKLPEVVTAGIRQRVTEDLTVLGGVEWTNWSRLGVVDIKNNAGAPAAPSIAFNYKDGWFASAGVEYAYSPDLKLRTGVGYEWSPINNSNRTARVPDDDRWWLSAGASYNYSEKLGFDLGYSYVFVDGKSKLDTTATAGGFIGTAKSDVHIIAAAVRYKFGGDAPAALVTKY